MRAGRIVTSIVAALMMLVGLAAMGSGIALAVAHATQRDADGFYTSKPVPVQTATVALLVRADAMAPGAGEWLLDRIADKVRVQVTPTGATPLFVGIGPVDQVRNYLAATGYERITRLDSRSLEVTTELVPGALGQAEPPAEQHFWVASVTGPGQQTLLWDTEPGDWALVAMNADGRRGLVLDAKLGAATDSLLPIGIGIGAFGLVLLLAGVGSLLVAVTRSQRGVASDISETTAAPGAYPVRLDARLEPGLSRWLWLVKWLLVIPHLIVLVGLWLVALVLTVAVGFAILFTGRYPRAIFDFNVGVMRWSWRVAYYSFGALATDRYPPFSLHPDPTYPAELTVEYPQRLSRGLVLVKWWLLAIPHYLIVGLLATGWWGWTRDDWTMRLGGGLIGILVLIAAVVLLFRGTYPRGLYDIVMGMQRWCYRVYAYVALMRDEYPPFRLDLGGPDPGSVPAEPAGLVPPEPAGPAEPPSGQRSLVRT